jgi:thiamine pyrophosphokinase
MSTPTTRAVVVIGGGPLSPHGVAHAGDAWVVAADSGYDHARDAGLSPAVLIGDLDSISSEGLAVALAEGTEIIGHPAAKDLTDTELALDLSVDRGATDVLLLGGPGDRLDHLLGTIGALGRPSLAACTRVTAWLGGSRVHTAHPGRTVLVDEPAGTTFSVLTLHGACTGVEVIGATWSLHDATLAAGSARGVSNVVTSEPCTVRTGTGVLTVVIP